MRGYSFLIEGKFIELTKITLEVSVGGHVYFPILCYNV